MQLLDQTVRRRLTMHANRPHPVPFLHRRPKLLRNPRQAPSPEGNPRKSVRDSADSFIPQRAQSPMVKPVPRRNPYPRIQTMAAQNHEPRTNPVLLGLFGHTRKLRVPMQGHKAPALAVANMPIAVQPDRGPRRLHRSHPRPELRIRRRNIQLWIAIFRDHGKDRPDSEFLDYREKSLQPFPRHRRAKIVETEKVLGLHLNHRVADRGRSRAVQYHRKKKVLTVQSDVAKAIPAIPNHRISTRLIMPQ